ncbi:UDP-N-acetylmuramoyl-tripeptide--D-alanyl-D-alanine ligase [Candidatus Synechococcus calcipolaris G9]|uniref:UDP-N-acetylmuramoyl-tripeptide--D-alanyl-D-alanine ligase n=1 Tax=Candidatus Synechococcus calcipolaris G9 TaxID=1497997 RepID=A0ABT6EX77_9SYNE|nr:UDP-N-acetylmuramoyl-tripeptide--D-alanyl-D-alanine ligase [Candidatus Synechococcus calcipolaris]MDG2990358.1 UDP-N-acetylmuramoyl-tripeptide--D-alanyl-D-alanine ligase [Candidatus Synechococcus calcipolaris G9]
MTSFSATLAQLGDILAAPIVNDSPSLMGTSSGAICTDSRELRPGDVFLALRGDNFDGHGFVATAKEGGAIAAIVDHPLKVALPQLIVKDTLAAYQAIAQWWRNQVSATIIAVTGSVGKTTTKELIAAVLGCYGSVLKTEANNNNEIGVPKTLLHLTHDHDYAVIEMGMRGPGEIALLGSIAQPDIGVITNVGTAHIGRLGSRQAIAEAKCELLAQLRPKGTAVLNGENDLLMATAPQVWSGATITYGLTTGQLRGHIIPDNRLQVGDYAFPLPLVGEHHALNYLAAIAVARACHLDLAPLQAGITLTLPKGRGGRYTLRNDIVLLDETYNAGLESMVASLRLLAAMPPGTRRGAVLGAMRELGDYAIPFHYQVGEEVSRLGLDYLVVLDDGSEGEALIAGAQSTPSQRFDTHDQVIDYLKGEIEPGDRILFKASHSVGLDRVVQALRQEFQG